MAGPLEELIAKLGSAQDLTTEEARLAATALADAEVEQEAKKAFLVALHQKGETVAEVRTFAEVYRELARDPGLSAYADRAVDVVGTGGTGFGGYNVSSLSALILAASGVPVLKHGNRAITSMSGSADFLGALGVPMLTEPEHLQRCVEATGFCFFFAPGFHPAYREIMPVRQALAAEGQRTVFNILGPLINPARPRRQLLGVSGESWVAPLAQVLTDLEAIRGLSVYCQVEDGGMDELGTVGRNIVSGIGDFAGPEISVDLAALGLTGGVVSELRGGSPEENIELMRAMMAGKGPPTLVNTILLNAGAALWISGQVAGWPEGVERAREVLQEGRLEAWLKDAQEVFSELTREIA